MTGHRMEAVADSTLAKWLARFVMPAMVAIIGWFLMSANSRIERTQASQSEAQQTQGEDIAAIKSDIRDVNTRLDAQVIRQVDQNTQNTTELRKRVEIIERSVHVP